MKNLLLIVVLFSWCFQILFSQNNQKANLTIKEKHIDKRYVHPKSKYISISGGWGFTSTVFDAPISYFNKGLYMSNNTYLPNVTYEHGIKNNYFGEIGYSYIGQGIGGFLYSRFYSNHDFQIGMGYRFINKSNYQFFNIHTGLFIGLANEKLENLPHISVYTRFDQIKESEYFFTRNVTAFQPISFGPYIGISKEFRLFKDVRFFIKYMQRFGSIPTMSGTFKLSSNEIDFDNDFATFKVRGGGAFITGGLKILLFKKKLENYDE
ncbi:MAG: hypothetical protein JJT77_06440 [Crocinitomicaceae bacterium]|nr:hypothetical protein [Crocinitomicaceae bacterium]